VFPIPYKKVSICKTPGAVVIKINFIQAGESKCIGTTFWEERINKYVVGVNSQKLFYGYVGAD
jgi:hypothetical protein